MAKQQIIADKKYKLMKAFYDARKAYKEAQRKYYDAIHAIDNYERKEENKGV